MRNVKEKIKTVFENETPNIKSRILDSIENEVQLSPDIIEKPRLKLTIFKRMGLVLSICLIFAVGIVSGYFIPKKDDVVSLTAENFVYIDVNPSVEMSLTSENLVVDCKAANDDAEKILQGINLKGVELNTALNAIVGAMYVNGYLSHEENSMLISVDGVSEEKTIKLLNLLTQNVNKVFENSEVDCSIIAQRVESESELVKRATENGVSIGKMQLVDKLIGSFDEFDETNVVDLAKMSIKELSLIYKNKPNNGDEIGTGDIVSGMLGGFLDKDGALLAVTKYLQVSLEEVDDYWISIKPSILGGLSLKYDVKITLKSGIEYRFDVDCKTGEVELGITLPEQDGSSKNEQSGHR